MSTFVWFEHVSTEPARAQGFYGELFGWGTREVPLPSGAYTMIAAGEHAIGGYLAPSPGAPTATRWVPSLHVTDVAASSALAVKLGGTLLRPAWQVGDLGTRAIVADPQGGIVSLWQPARTEEPPPPADHQVTWLELGSRDPDASVAFYRELGAFGLESTDMGPEIGMYHMLTADGVPVAGIARAEVHAWTPYVQVANTDSTVERSQKLGAAIVEPPADVPEIGRYAIITDPQGARVGIVRPPASP